MLIAARCSVQRSALQWPMQRAAMTDAPLCDNWQKTVPRNKECCEPACTPAPPSAKGVLHLPVFNQNQGNIRAERSTLKATGL